MPVEVPLAVTGDEERAARGLPPKHSLPASPSYQEARSPKFYGALFRRQAICVLLSPSTFNRLSIFFGNYMRVRSFLK